MGGGGCLQDLIGWGGGRLCLGPRLRAPGNAAVLTQGLSALPPPTPPTAPAVAALPGSPGLLAQGQREPRLLQALPRPGPSQQSWLRAAAGGAEALHHCSAGARPLSPRRRLAAAHSRPEPGRVPDWCRE